MSSHSLLRSALSVLETPIKVRRHLQNETIPTLLWRLRHRKLPIPYAASTLFLSFPSAIPCSAHLLPALLPQIDSPSTTSCRVYTFRVYMWKYCTALPCEAAPVCLSLAEHRQWAVFCTPIKTTPSRECLLTTHPSQLPPSPSLPSPFATSPSTPHPSIPVSNPHSPIFYLSID